MSQAFPENRVVHPIETESFRRLRARLDTSHFPPLTRAVVERVIHSAADLDYAGDLVTDEAALERGHAALHAGAPVVVDVEMVAAGITRRETVCRLKDARSGPRLTRSAHAMRLAYEEVGPGALWVIGCAPTALEELLTLGADPALVIGLPVGFVGATESKAALRESGLPAVSNVSEKGGSAVAVAALNALLYCPVRSGASGASPSSVSPLASAGSAAPVPPISSASPRSPASPASPASLALPAPSASPAPLAESVSPVAPVLEEKS